MSTLTIIGLIFLALIIGVIAGIFLIGILACGKSSDMWRAIELSAYKNDNTLCKELLELNQN